jgi:uncharacterized protein YdbL (DUF1318 family)
MIRRLLLAMSLGLSLLATGAAAQSSAKAIVDAAKAAGVVGEQADGYLGLVTGSADPSVRAQAYKDIAAKTGVTERAAGEATAQQLISRLAPGSYDKPLGGSWTRK